MRKFLLAPLLVVALGSVASAQTPAPAPPPGPDTPPPAATAQAPTADASTAAPAPTVPAVPVALALEGPSSMVFHAVKADKVADFEAVMTRLRDVLAASADDVRRKQAAGWRVYRQAAPLPSGAVLFVSVIEPVVPNAEYDVARLLAEGVPAEAAQLYQQFRDAHVEPTVQASNLSLVLTLAPQAAGPAQP